jgi:hypothetical protein
MGESKRRRQGALIDGRGEADPAQVLDTLGGRMHVRWDQGAAATPHGQLVFLSMSTLFDGSLISLVEGRLA